MSANRPPEDALWLQDIREQLDSLVRTAEQRWQRIAALLHLRWKRRRFGKARPLASRWREIRIL